MPKGDKYTDLTRYLNNCGHAEIEMTFQQVKDIVGELPHSAYKYQAFWSDGSQGSFSYGWLNAGYSACVHFHKQLVIFTKSDLHSSRRPSAIKTGTSKKSSLNFDLAINKTLKYYSTTTDSKHTRYRSWEHCYSAFVSCPENPSKDQIDYLCLHLAWYLASWGMLRNSFLMNHDYLIHKPLLTRLLTPHFLQLHSENQSKKSVPITLEAADMIKSSYPFASITDTLITKILLGVFGSAPAYDRFFVNAARKYTVCGGAFGGKSLEQLWSYYNEYCIEFEQLQKQLSGKGIQYPPMKIIDMCLWQLGYEETDQAERDMV